MFNQHMFAIYDAKVEAHLTPFFARNNEDAMRMVGMKLRQDPENPLAICPDDYTLFAIGVWDEVHGLITPLKANINLGVLSTLMLQPGHPVVPVPNLEGDIDAAYTNGADNA